jgi:hypothetical protein
MNSNNESALQACEMRILREIEGKMRRDRIRNKIIREIVGIQSVQEYVERSNSDGMVTLREWMTKE